MACLKILQFNVNYSKVAQDLAVHMAYERKCALLGMIEPYKAPSAWPTDDQRYVTIRATAIPGISDIILKSKEVVMAVWDDIVICCCYLPPGQSILEVEATLDEIHSAVRRTNTTKLLVLGDFNAASTLWGSQKTNPRGELIEDWAASLNLILLNEGNISICVRPMEV